MPGCARQAAPAHTFAVADGQFLYDGQPLQIRSGSIHYARVPRDYWRQRLEMARAMGLNTVTTYVFWNLNEPRSGQFDFSGRRDVAAFVRLAGELGLHVIVRPGPYVCSEWDLGGIPAWLLADSSVVVRTQDSTYMAAARRWILRVGQELAPLQITRGGPIIGVQVENEYGSFGADSVFMRRTYDDYRAAGFDASLLFTADGPSQLPRGTLPGVRAVVNFGPGYADSAFARLHRFRPDEPIMVGEYWAGWFDGWGVPHHTTNAQREADEIGWMLAQGASFNIYMFHGGTSFGFMSGANFYNDAYQPQTTSYDYDAALDEAGHVTPKYRLIRQAIASRLPPGDTLPTPPAAPPVIAVPRFPLTQAVSLFDAGRSCGERRAHQLRAAAHRRAQGAHGRRAAERARAHRLGYLHAAHGRRGGAAFPAAVGDRRGGDRRGGVRGGGARGGGARGGGDRPRPRPRLVPRHLHPLRRRRHVPGPAGLGEGGGVGERAQPGTLLEHRSAADALHARAVAAHGRERRRRVHPRRAFRPFTRGADAADPGSTGEWSGRVGCILAATSLLDAHRHVELGAQPRCHDESGSRARRGDLLTVDGDHGRVAA
ncbi:MAG: beta-galactosidase [Gemmatimonadota bacterium]